MKRPAYYFKLKKDFRMNTSLSSGIQTFLVQGYIMKRSKTWLPVGFDEEVQYMNEEYGDPDQYNTALLSLENQAFKLCEKLNSQQDAIEDMIATHESKLKKLNLGYQLVGWFRGMGGDNGST